MPTTVKLPSLNSMSLSAASSICAANLRPLAMMRSQAPQIALPPTEAARLPPVPPG